MAKRPASKAVKAKVGKYRRKTAAYAVLVAAVVAWIVLSFTVWGNPSPEDRCEEFIRALNARDHDAFMALILPERKEQGESLFWDIVDKLGEQGKIPEANLQVYEINNYEARGSVTGEGISLEITLENREGSWYINPGVGLTMFSL